ncbi:hypothetical protein Y032_0105g3718 [Ancylostoma ceylanicum]|uniref:Uncharacterized protein n=1 Tax=Ancylostoma ceylanicum TaxID=53326 RepID=A0A016TGM0_9BILA|nr:hypothetical protein Y032_0105g3718 [Ancylostoma ceylanicum]
MTLTISYCTYYEDVSKVIYKYHMVDHGRRSKIESSTTFKKSAQGFVTTLTKCRTLQRLQSQIRVLQATTRAALMKSPQLQMIRKIWCFHESGYCFKVKRAIYTRQTHASICERLSVKTGQL